MSAQTDLNVSPFFDDYDENKDFYKILFRPGVAVQVRELNQLQSILQKQIERFGDNVLKAGTIVRGCDISFHDDLRYVKIKDAQVDSVPVDVTRYGGYRVRNQNDISPLQAAIIATTDGYETQTPNLNTLYLRYLNTGYKTGGAAEGYSEFEADETLTIYSPANVIESVTINNPSSGFTSSDRVVFSPAIAIQNTTFGTAFANSFYVGDYITDGYANAQIVSAPDTTIMPGYVVLKIKPTSTDLQAYSSSAWTFSSNTTIQSSNTAPSDTAIIAQVLGSGASGSLSVSALGQINSISMLNKGSGYTVTPEVSIASATASTSQIALFDADAQNHLAKVTTAGLATSPVGTSYAITVGDGVVYQKGFFARVDEHLLIVDKYSNVPDGKVVGFETYENVVNSSEDVSLLDNTTGAPNETAPGADRLKLTPTLIVLDKGIADQRDDFLYIAEFSNGLPYKQNRQTVYNIIGNEIARRTHETSGNYVLDQFHLNTKAANTLTADSTTFKAVVDPGSAYISGNRVVTENNFETSVAKGVDTVSGDVHLSLNYGSYIYVKEFAGTFLFKEGAELTLYSSSGNFLSNAVGTISNGSLGTVMGTCRIRSMVHDSGVIGSPSCIYRLYLFDIRMAAGKNFKDVRSVYHNGAQKGICDIVRDGSGNAVLQDPNQGSLIFYAGQNAVKSANSISYVYRTIDTSQTLSTTGVITVVAGTGEQFPYTGTLTTTQERNVIVTPLANATSTVALTGNVSSTAGSKVLTGTGTAFTTDLQSGDFIWFDTQYGQVDNIANSTYLTLVANAPSNHSNQTFYRYFPQNVPISFDRSTRTMSTNAPNYDQLTINLNETLSASTPVSVAYNMRSNPDAAVVTKTVNRNKFVRICAANNVSSSVGPWSLGVTDVIRLNGVYKGANGTFGVTGAEDVTSNYYIDHNQTEDYLGTSFLYPNPKSTPTISGSDWLLVSFDYLTTSAEGVKKAGSGTYPLNDTVALNSATNTMHTLEIPEVYGSGGAYYDLRDSFDFRPQGNNTVTPSSTASTAPLNPIEATVIIKTGDKKFPAPDSDLTASVEYYVGRQDRVIVDHQNNIRVLSGTAGSSYPPAQPDNSITVGVLDVVPYPSIPYKLSQDLVSYLDTSVLNIRYANQRNTTYAIKGLTSESAKDVYQPRSYTMEQIAKLEKRIADLEYYVSLTMVEQMAQKRSIASSTDANVDRYKFGFYVNSFEDYTYADISDPGYNASIVDGYLSTAVSELNLPALPTTTQIGLPFEEVTFVAQTRATADLTSTSASTTTAQKIVSVVQSNRTRSARDYPPYIYEDFNYKFSATSGPVEFYINSRDNYIAVEFYQSQDGVTWSPTPVANSRTSTPLTNYDIAVKQLSLNGKIEHPGSMESPGWGPVGRWIEDHFKILWTYNPEFGQHVMVRVYKGKNHGSAGKEGTYQFKMYYPIDAAVDLNTTAPTTNYLLAYRGLFDYLNNRSNWKI